MRWSCHKLTCFDFFSITNSKYGSTSKPLQPDMWLIKAGFLLEKSTKT